MPVKNTLLVAFALAAACAQAMTGDNVAAPFRGTWVPANAACTSPLKVEVDANAVTFINGNERQAYRKLEQCFSCMGQSVQDVTLLTTDQMGDSPWQLYLDSSKKTPAVSADLSGDKKLAARFPFRGGAPLKKCR
jgi:hypothetical protein